MTGDAGTRWAERLATGALLVGASVFLFTAAVYLPSPLRFDEVEWPVQARGILDHGVPKATFEENPWIWLHSPFGYDAAYGMWHPPVYLYSLAAAGAVFGLAEPVVRGVGVAWFLGSLWLLRRIARRVAPEGLRAASGRLAVGLALLAPLVAEGALYLDIDNTSLAFALLLLLDRLLAAAAAEEPEKEGGEELGGARRGSLRGGWPAAGLFAFALASKLTTPPLLLGSFGLWLLLRREVRRAALLPAAIGGVGAALFAAGYAGYCALLDYPAGFMFDISYLGKTGMYAQAHGLRLALASARWHLVWVSPAVCLLLVGALAARARAWRRTRRAEPVDLPLVFFAVCGLVYVPWGGMVGKYMFPAVLAGIAGAAPVALAAIARLGGRPAAPDAGDAGAAAALRRSLAWAGAGLAIVHLAAVPALRFRPPGSAERTATWAGALLDPRNFAVAASLAAFAAALAWLWRRERTAPRPAVAAAALVLYAAIANPLDAAKLQVRGRELSPLHPFAERGFRETATLAADLCRDRGPIVAPKDLGYLFPGRHYSTEYLHAHEGRETLRRVLAAPEICAVVDSRLYPTLAPEDLAALPPGTERVPVGSFDVYRLRGRSAE